MSARTFLLLIALAGGLLQNRATIKHWLFPPPPRPAGSETVVLYSTTWCGYCAKTREYFRDNGIVYEDRDVETTTIGKTEYEKLGGGGVPIVVVNDAAVIRGFQPDAIDDALSRERP
jgi:glutaredoxin